MSADEIKIIHQRLDEEYIREEGSRFPNHKGSPNAKAQPERLTTGNKSSRTSDTNPPKSNRLLNNSELETNKRRVRSYATRRLQRSLIADIHPTLSLCGLGVIGNPDGSPGTARFACDHASGATFQTGVMTCHSPWSCPVCAPKVASRRALALKPQIDRRVKEGFCVSLLTLTLRHKKHQSLDDMFTAQSLAWGMVTSGRWWNDLRKQGKLEYIRGYDCTYSERHGWHPHLHICLLVGPEFSSDGDDGCEEVSEAILSRWRAALASLGWSTTREAQHYDRADDPEKAARYAVTPAAVYESLAMAMKKARGKGSGLTPFEILEKATQEKADGVERSKWVGLWREYVSSTKGRRQVVTSQGLSLVPDDDDAPSEEADNVLEVGPEALREMDKADLVPEVLTIMDDVGAAAKLTPSPVET